MPWLQVAALDRIESSTNDSALNYHFVDDTSRMPMVEHAQVCNSRSQCPTGRFHLATQEDPKLPLLVAVTFPRTPLVQLLDERPHDLLAANCVQLMSQPTLSASSYN